MLIFLDNDNFLTLGSINSGQNLVLLAGSGNTAHIFDDFAEKLSSTSTTVISIVPVCESVRLIGKTRDYGELMRMLALLKAVVLMDMNMPSEVPLEPEVLKMHLGPACLLAISAWFDSVTEKRAREYGAAELLEKTTLAETLQSAIDRCMEPNEKAGR